MTITPMTFSYATKCGVVERGVHGRARTKGVDDRGSEDDGEDGDVDYVDDVGKADYHYWRLMEFSIVLLLE